MKKNELEVITKFEILMNVIILVSCGINLFVNSCALAYFNWGALCILLPLTIITLKLNKQKVETMQGKVDLSQFVIEGIKWKNFKETKSSTKKKTQKTRSKNTIKKDAN